jgi:hypothetical protein
MEIFIPNLKTPFANVILCQPPNKSVQMIFELKYLVAKFKIDKVHVDIKLICPTTCSD